MAYFYAFDLILYSWFDLFEFFLCVALGSSLFVLDEIEGFGSSIFCLDDVDIGYLILFFIIIGLD